MGKSFKTHIKSYFETFGLSNEQVCRLERMQTDGCALSIRAKMFRAPLAQVAMVIFLLGVTWYCVQYYRNTAQVDQLVAEIVYNHNKQMAMEIESDAIDTVKAFLTKLDFPLIATHRLPGAEWRLLGGRYCSLQGKLAAQLKLRHLSSGEIYTLFQTACPDGIDESTFTNQTFVNGIEVQLWFERGLLLGMARGR